MCSCWCRHRRKTAGWGLGGELRENVGRRYASLGMCIPCFAVPRPAPHTPHPALDESTSAGNRLSAYRGGINMSADCLPLKAIHHVELLVGNAKQAAYYYRHAFGFSQLAYAGPETGIKDQASYVLYQGRIVLVLSTPLKPDDPMADQLRRHGDGVLDIAFLVDDVDAVFAEAVEHGARGTRAVRPHRQVRPHSPGEDSHLRRHAALADFDERLYGPLFAGLPGSPASGSRSGTRADRSHRGKCRRRPDERLGHVLQQGARLPSVHVVRRQGHLHRVFGVVEPGDGAPERRDQVPDQRAGQRQT